MSVLVDLHICDGRLECIVTAILDYASCLIIHGSAMHKVNLIHVLLCLLNHSMIMRPSSYFLKIPIFMLSAQAF
jgi:hypothetical protein